MRLGILADIHEDVPKLTLALRHLRREGVEQVVVLGDVFETGRRLNETVALLAEAGAVGDRIAAVAQDRTAGKDVLLGLRELDQKLGYLADLARRLPDPRSPKFVTHSAEQILTQQIYQILADYPDCNDADALRTNPLFQVLAGGEPHP